MESILSIENCIVQLVNPTMSYILKNWKEKAWMDFRRHGLQIRASWGAVLSGWHIYPATMIYKPH